MRSAGTAISGLHTAGSRQRTLTGILVARKDGPVGKVSDLDGKGAGIHCTERIRSIALHACAAAGKLGIRIVPRYVNTQQCLPSRTRRRCAGGWRVNNYAGPGIRRRASDPFRCAVAFFRSSVAYPSSHSAIRRFSVQLALLVSLLFMVTVSCQTSYSAASSSVQPAGAFGARCARW